MANRFRLKPGSQLLFFFNLLYVWRVGASWLNAAVIFAGNRAVLTHTGLLGGVRRK